MKRTITGSMLLLTFCAQSFAQDCKQVFYFSPGAEVIFTKYDKAGKVVGKDKGTISNVREDNGSLKSDYRLIKYESDGRIKEDGRAEIICDRNGLKLGFQVPDMESGNKQDAYFTYPANMKAGQALEAKMEMQIKGRTNGKKMDVYFKVENRKVIGPEKITTPAGKFDAVRISYDMTIRFKVAGIGIPMKIKIFEWYSPGTGVVRTETYKGDVLEETSVLSSIKKAG